MSRGDVVLLLAGVGLILIGVAIAVSWKNTSRLPPLASRNRFVRQIWTAGHYFVVSAKWYAVFILWSLGFLVAASAMKWLG